VARPQHASEAGATGPSRQGIADGSGVAGAGRLQYPRRLWMRQPANDYSQLVGGEPVNLGPRHIELELAAGESRQVQVSPIEDNRSGAPREAREPEPSQHRHRADLHPDQARARAALGKQHVAHADDALPGQVDHLGVEHVPSQRELFLPSASRARGGAVDAPRTDRVLFVPADPQRGLSPPPHVQGHDRRVLAGAFDFEVGEAANSLTLEQHLLPEQFA
jgi:hypothetical protein